MSAGTVTYRPVECKSGFGAARRAQIVHRVKLAEHITHPGGSYLHMKWLCGSESRDPFFVEDPEPLGGICERCDLIFLTDAVVYRCWSAAERLLYIGSCARWSDRETQHEKQTPWWPEVARVDKEPYPNLGTAKAAERAAIKAEAPIHNKVHNVKRFRREGASYVPVTEAA
jgi:hypothetical protein